MRTGVVLRIRRGVERRRLDLSMGLRNSRSRGWFEIMNILRWKFAVLTYCMISCDIFCLMCLVIPHVRFCLHKEGFQLHSIQSTIVVRD
jgi:hypothetical protein